MQHVLLIDNPLDESTWERLETDDVRELLMKRYPEWPATARIYVNQCAQANDVTPRCEADIEKLIDFERLVVIVYPGHIAVILIIAIVVAVIATVATFLLLPKIPELGNVQTTSPNNGLSERSNKPRPGARIPDIFGTVRSTPDLVARPYRVYENHRELEIAYMCIGRGAYDVSDVRDGDTLIEDILGSSVEVYGPNDSPNDGSTPQLTIGSSIGDPVFNTARLNDVNGQTMKAPNDNAIQAEQEIRFTDGGIIEAGVGIDFTDYFHADDEITIGNAATSGTTDPAAAIFVAATGLTPNKFTFVGYDPRGDFTAGDPVRIEQAVWTHDGGTGGDLGGGTSGGGGDNPQYPDDRFPHLDEPIA